MSDQDQGYQEAAKSYVRIMWMISFLTVLMAIIFFVFLSKTQLPDTESLENPEIELATQILARDGEQLGKAFKHNRELVRYEQLNPHFINALVATEDERFFDHSGIDTRSLMRAIVFMGKKGGASTITQQLAKQFFTKGSKSLPKRIWQKLQEWAIAIEFERRYTKEEILAMYLNKFDFIYDSYGIGAASKTYFGKNQKKIKVEEAATLIGMLKNPYIYNPKRFPDRAQKRRNVVLAQMKKNALLSQKSFDVLKVRPVDVSGFKRADHFTGVAPYFRVEATKAARSILKNDKYKKPDGTPYDLYTDGLKIYTTIDYRMQKHAEKAMFEHMKEQQKKFFTRWKGRDPWTYRANKSQRTIRSNNLQRQMRESERFTKLRRRYLGKITGAIMTDIPEARLWDGDIFRLFAEEKTPGTLTKYVKNKTISKKQKDVYQKILKSDHWTKLKRDWRALRSKAKEVFNKPVRMVVFDYNSKGEKTVTMSPMDSIKYHNMHLQLGSISVDPKEGGIRTWVGGIDHKYFQFDHIRSNRQVGSTFKPFIYGTAISDLAMSPCQMLQDVRVTIPAGDPNFGLMKNWTPANANNKYSGEWMTMKEGLKKSLNTISVTLMKEIGNTERVRSFANNLGIPKKKIPNAPSICLGTPELSIMDLAGAYTTFANNGTRAQPYFIEKIVDKNGKIIYTGTSEKRKAYNPSYNYAMVDMLKYAATPIKSQIKTEVGGKTGTTNDYKDGWFMGITPNLVVATWVGGDVEWIRFLALGDGAGSRMARPYFVKFMQKIEADKSIRFDTSAKFTIPENMTVEIDCNKYDQLKNNINTTPTTPVPVEDDSMYDDEFEED